MLRGNPGFFWPTGDDIVDRYFDVAFFFRISPIEILELTLSEFYLYKDQSERIADELVTDN